MTDIVERLCRYGSGSPDSLLLMREAAEEIEMLWDAVAEKNAEVTRLRTLLAERDHQIEKLPALQKLWDALRKAELEANRNGPQIGDADPPAFLETLLREQERPIGMVTPIPHLDTSTPPDPVAMSTPTLPRVMLGAPMWIKDYDELGPAPGFPVGFTCRQCGTRVKGQRHVDPRLLCGECLPPANLNVEDKHERR